MSHGFFFYAPRPNASVSHEIQINILVHIINAPQYVSAFIRDNLVFDNFLISIKNWKTLLLIIVIVIFNCLFFRMIE